MESIQLHPACCRYGSNLVTVFDRPTFSRAEGQDGGLFTVQNYGSFLARRYPNGEVQGKREKTVLRSSKAMRRCCRNDTVLNQTDGDTELPR